jgi:hypothetical protein
VLLTSLGTYRSSYKNAGNYDVDSGIKPLTSREPKWEMLGLPELRTLTWSNRQTPRQVDALSMRASGRCLVPLLSFSVSSVYLIRVEMTFDVQVHILPTYDLLVGTEPRRKPGNIWISITRRTVSHPLRKWDVVSWAVGKECDHPGQTGSQASSNLRIRHSK